MKEAWEGKKRESNEIHLTGKHKARLVVRRETTTKKTGQEGAMVGGDPSEQCACENVRMETTDLHTTSTVDKTLCQ